MSDQAAKAPPDEPVAVPPTELINVPTIAPTAIAVDEFARAAAHLQMFDKLREVALKLTRPSDWHFFGDRPWPMRGAVEKISRAMGLNVKIHRDKEDTPYNKRFAQDEKGSYYVITVSGTIKGTWGELDAMGFCTSRDQFFAVDGKDGEGNPIYRPFFEIREEHLIQAAYTNFIANAVMRYTGISGFTKADLEKVYGVGNVSSHTYRENKPKATAEATAADSEKAKELWAICMVVRGGAEHEARDLLKELSAFQGRDGKEVPGVAEVKRLSGGRLSTTHSIAKKRWDAFLEKAGEKRAFYVELLQATITRSATPTEGGADGAAA